MCAPTSRARHLSAPATLIKHNKPLGGCCSDQFLPRLTVLRKARCRLIREDGDPPLSTQVAVDMPPPPEPAALLQHGRQTTCPRSIVRMRDDDAEVSFCRSPGTQHSLLLTEEEDENVSTLKCRPRRVLPPNRRLRGLRRLWQPGLRLDEASTIVTSLSSSRESRDLEDDAIYHWPPPRQQRRPRSQTRSSIETDTLAPASKRRPLFRLSTSGMRKEMLFLCFTLTILLSTLASSVEAKICSSKTIKHDVNKFKDLMDCTIIEGHLIIAAFEEKHVINYTFPRLREVTEYVMFYQAQNIVSLGHIFPNLAVIRGNKLIKDFALIVYQMNNINEIGLKSLTHILRGGVRIEKNRNLCYVNTVSWITLVHPRFHLNIHIEENEYDNMCPNVCSNCSTLGSVGSAKKGNCWGRDSCQLDPNDLHVNHDPVKERCDAQCIGGCDSTDGVTSHLDCVACANVMDIMSDGRKNCINKCPDTLLLYENWRCITKADCGERTSYYNAENINQERPYKIYKGKCLEICPPETEEIQTGGTWTCKECRDCAKECPGQTVSSLEVLQRFAGCTKILGDLIIQISGKNVVDQLEQYLGRVTVITGSLKVSRSFPIVSLDFFKSLREITGITTADTLKKPHYSLEILENENLQKLFPAKVKITFKNGPDASPEVGRAFIHYNQKLCRSEIKHMLNVSEMFDPGERSADISYGTNGHKSMCSENILKLKVERWQGFNGLQLTFDNYQETIAREGKADPRALLNYEIHYREISEEVYKAKSVTKFGGRDACGNDEWMITDHQPTMSTLDDINAGETWPIETSIITEGIKPFSYYAIFVTTLIIRQGIEGGEDIKSAASEIVYFQTPEGTPSNPRNIIVKSNQYSKVDIEWSPPEFPNGVIELYQVEVEHHQVNKERLLSVRPYCDDEEYMIKPEKSNLLPDSSSTKEDMGGGGATAPEGSCDCSKCPKGSETKSQDKESKEYVKLEEVNFLDEILNIVYTKDIRSGSRRRKRSNSSGGNSTNSIVLESEDDVKKDEAVLKKELESTMLVYNITVPGSQTTLSIMNLTHFSKYTVKIKACHFPRFDDLFGIYGPVCSDLTSLDFRTSKKENADNIPGTVSSSQDKNNGSHVWLEWPEPVDPNLVIVYYKVRIKMPHDTNRFYESCVTAADYIRDNRRHKPSVQGSFSVSVKAVSLAGAGEWTEDVKVTVSERSDHLLWFILGPVLVIVCTVIGCFTFFFVKKQRPEIMNPNYMKWNFGEFEIERSKIEQAETLGQGSFGMVYRGLYHSHEGDVPCAIKEAKDEEWREQLLGEAYRMRNIDTPHVVKLIGVVSEQYPQWVILELMDRGDLKQYLRSLRRNPPSPRDILVMACQVADGMAFLSTVPNPKIIHRDLAARNCMVNKDVIVKIGDFGLARDLDYAEDYYRMKGRDHMPIRWMSPESLTDAVFSTASDVWAFGVVLWEMVTLAEQPYQGLTNEEVLNMVRNGRTMEIPINCPELIAQIMANCWRFDPHDRPSFIDISRMLLDFANDEFRKNSFVTSNLCQRLLARLDVESAEAVVPIEVAERMPLQANGSNSNSNGNGNGEAIRQMDNGHAVAPASGLASESINMRELNLSTSDIDESLEIRHQPSSSGFGRFNWRKPFNRGGQSNNSHSLRQHSTVEA